ncbi:MAG: hypothetical protein ACI92S_000192 [Planctomycetaceae bacterium]|jgi:hypothetical protein
MTSTFNQRFHGIDFTATFESEAGKSLDTSGGPAVSVGVQGCDAISQQVQTIGASVRASDVVTCQSIRIDT